ncbi:MAG: 50S ribosomal protein L3 [Clostridia bacterium]|nr:50S ribosomal protein L3 [Clostridia bacterium]MDD4376275.1 50S ribosomal protein L3 [Clostridia bacterium]
MKEIYGKKLGMTQMFDNDGKAIPVTVIEVNPMIVIAKKTVEKEGYNAIVVSFGEIKEKNVNKPMKGIFAKAGVPVKRNVKEIKVDNIDEYEIGKEIDISILTEGDKIDVRAVSKGKGFQGNIKRHGQSRGPSSHGSHYHRRPGSMGGTTTPGKVFKNKKLPGHMGAVNRAVLNLEVVKVDSDKKAILVKGSIPGTKKAIVNIKKSVKSY